MSEHIFGNQHDNYQGIERAIEFYKRPLVKARTDDIAEYLFANPEEHVVPSVKHFKVRVGSSRKKRVSFRPLVALAMGYPLPKYGYTHTSCGVAGCVNPKCQVFAESYDHMRSFTVVQAPEKKPLFTVVKA